MKKEIEIKFKLENKENINKKLEELGGQKKKPYTQTAYGFFSDDSVKKGIFPRIRIEAGIPILTVKVKNNKKKTNYFERNEYSLKISNFKTGIKILKILGFDKIRRFTKVRTQWVFRRRPIEVCVDKLYFGRFLELEASKKEIEKMIKSLGFQRRKRISKAYLAIEEEYKKAKIK
jgi:adenylate cyclase class 2